MSGIDDGGRLADADRGPPAAQARAEAADPRDGRAGKRLEHLLGVIEGEVDIPPGREAIRGRVKRQMEKSQREYYLNEQIKAIQKELGEGDENADLEEMEKKIKSAKMSKEAEARRCRAQEAQDDVADVGRGDGRAHVHRHAHVAAVAQEEQDQQGFGHQGRRCSTPITTASRR